MPRPQVAVFVPVGQDAELAQLVDVDAGGARYLDDHVGSMVGDFNATWSNSGFVALLPDGPQRAGRRSA